MIVELLAVSKGSALPPTTVSVSSSEAIIVQAETERRPTVLSLIASGRMRPDTGVVSIDHEVDYAALRKSMALIDAPDVSDPAEDVVLSGVVAEELMFAGRHAHHRAVRETLQDLGYLKYARTIMADLPAVVRIRTLTELAIMREDVKGIVLTSPDRHGGEPAEWWAIATDLASRGYAVLVVAGRASASIIAELQGATEDVSVPGTLTVEAPVDAATEPEQAPDAEPDPETTPPADPEPTADNDEDPAATATPTAPAEDRPQPPAEEEVTP